MRSASDKTGVTAAFSHLGRRLLGRETGGWTRLLLLWVEAENAGRGEGASVKDMDQLGDDMSCDSEHSDVSIIFALCSVVYVVI